MTVPGAPMAMAAVRIIVMGPPGSGKSTLARRLDQALDLPVTHLDALHHAAGWTPRPRVDFYADVARAVAAPRWVIDGNYSSVSAGRLAVADLVVLLDLPRHVTMMRLLRRIATGYAVSAPTARPAVPSGSISASSIMHGRGVRRSDRASYRRSRGRNIRRCG